MLTLLITVVLGVFFAIFATQNTETIVINLGSYTISNVPTYLAALVPLLVGLLLAYFIYLIRDLSQNLTIGEQRERIRKLKEEIVQTRKDAHKFQVENVKLKKDHGVPNDQNSI